MPNPYSKYSGSRISPVPAGYLSATAASAANLQEGIAGLGQSIGEGIAKYQEKKKKKAEAASVREFMEMMNAPRRKKEAKGGKGGKGGKWGPRAGGDRGTGSGFNTF